MVHLSTASELANLRSGQAKLAWLAWNTQPDLAFDVGALAAASTEGDGSGHRGH